MRLPTAPSRVLSRAPRRPGAAFILVEVVAAVGILLLVGLAGVSTQVTCLSLVRTSGETKMAAAELEAAMEEILSRTLEEIPDAAGPFAPGVPVAAFNERYLEGQSVVVTYPGYAGGLVPDPLEISITLTWNDFAGRPRTLTLAGMKTR